MSFDVEGFTGISGKSIRESQIKTHAELFDFAKACSQHAMAVTKILPKSNSKIEIFASLFFARCTSSFQAAICLAEGGMTIEALILCRSLLETFFVLNALAEGVVTPEELASHDSASRKSHANALLNQKNKYENVAPFEATLKEFVSKQDGSIEIKIYEFARKGSALAAYDGLYRHLSHHAAHPSLSSIDPYIVEMPGDRVRVLFHPILSFTERAVLSACIGILLSCFACEKLGLFTAHTKEVGTQLWLKYQTIYEASDPWAN